MREDGAGEEVAAGSEASRACSRRGGRVRNPEILQRGLVLARDVRPGDFGRFSAPPPPGSSVSLRLAWSKRASGLLSSDLSLAPTRPTQRVSGLRKPEAYATTVRWECRIAPGH